MRRSLVRLALFSVLLAIVPVFAGCGVSVAHQPVTPPTATPTAPPRPGAFYFTTSDGVTLGGKILGKGKTALIFSNGKGLTMGLWEAVAQTMADRGYMSFLYDYRGLGQSQGWDIPAQREDDLRAAITVAQAHGATKVVLIGSSFGALLSARLASEAHAAAIVLVSSPLRDSGIVLSDGYLQTLAAPKLLIVSEQDGSFISDTQHIYEMSAQPKQIAIYPGRQHGPALLVLEHGADSMQRLIAFLNKYAPV